MCHQKLQYREYVKIYNVNEGIGVGFFFVYLAGIVQVDEIEDCPKRPHFYTLYFPLKYIHYV